MKYKSLLLGISILAVAFSSCTLEKRLYRKGFYIERGTAKDGNISFSPVENPPNEQPSKTAQTSNTFKTCEPEVAANERFASTTSFSSISEEKSAIVANQPEVAHVDSTASNTREENSDNKTNSLPRSDDEGNSALTVIGWILIGLGGVILWFVSILIGILLMVLGLVFIIVGRKKGGGSKSKENGGMVDVVYLKNGSIVRGTIIEQVPGESLKIQTADGSVFFYKMDEIEKITKEKSAN